MSVLELWTKPQVLHAIAVHFPIVLGLVGVPVVFAAAFSEKHRYAFLWTAILLYVVMLASAFGATLTGEEAIEQIPPTAPEAVWDTAELHEELAEQVWFFAAVTGVLLVLGLINVTWVRIPIMTLAIVASIATGAWVCIVGHFGGALVYEFGVGTPANEATAPLVIEPEPDEMPVAEPMEPGEEPAPALPEAPTQEPAPALPEAPTQEPDPTLPAAPTEAPGVPASDEPEDETSQLIPILNINMADARKVDYESDIQSIFEARCVSCHDADTPASGLDLTTYAGVMAGGAKTGDVVVPHRPGQSTLVGYIRGEYKPLMPKRGAPLTTAQVHTIRMWIAAGAQYEAE